MTVYETALFVNRRQRLSEDELDILDEEIYKMEQDPDLGEDRSDIRSKIIRGLRCITTKIGYNSDVSDKQWERLQKYLPELSTRGAHLRKWEPRVIINAILYVVTTIAFLVWMVSKTQHRL